MRLIVTKILVDKSSNNLIFLKIQQALIHNYTYYLVLFRNIGNY